MDLQSRGYMCQYCNLYFTYWDYLSHLEICGGVFGCNELEERSNPDEEYDTTDGYDAGDEDEIHSSNTHSQQQSYSQTLNPDNSSNNRNTNAINRFRDSMMDINLDNITYQMGIVQLGLTLEDLAKYSKEYMIPEIQECNICLDTKYPGEIFLMLGCNHSFCKNCCHLWFQYKNKCPFCNHNITIDL